MNLSQNSSDRDKTPQPLHVLIIGGGIGGLCLAQGLKKAGVSVAIYERDRTLDARLQGYRLNIEPVGSRALYQCLPPELWEVLVATAGDPGPIMGVFTEQLHELMQEDEHIKPHDQANSAHAVSRVTLRRLLLAGLSDVVHFDKAFVRYEQTADGKVRAYFADGTSATGDVLVGADGVHSRVRRQLLPDASLLDLTAIGVAGKLALTETTASWLPKALVTHKNMIFPPRNFLFTSIFHRRESSQEVARRLGKQLQMVGLSEESLHEAEEGDYVMWAFVAHRRFFPASVQGLRGRTLLDLVEQSMRNWHPDLRRLITSSDAETVEHFEFEASAQVKPWPSTNVTLLGDAIHAMPPVGGMGGNTALRDASLLCRHLVAVSRGEKALVPALHAYEGQMLTYGFKVVKQTRQMLQMAIAPSRLLRAAARTFFWLCGVVPPLRRAVFSEEEDEPPTEESRQRSGRSLPDHRPSDASRRADPLVGGLGGQAHKEGSER
jgi:2-polyprenyl-6-methoxyphenol hydroxylase-like FAD-dependent oxidoreductase